MRMLNCEPQQQRKQGQKYDLMTSLGLKAFVDILTVRARFSKGQG